MAYFDGSTICDVYEKILKQTLVFQHIRIVDGDVCIEEIGKGLVSLRQALHTRVLHSGSEACLMNGKSLWDSPDDTRCYLGQSK